MEICQTHDAAGEQVKSRSLKTGQHTQNIDILVKRFLGSVVEKKKCEISTWSWVSLKTFINKSDFPFGAQTLQGVQVFTTAAERKLTRAQLKQMTGHLTWKPSRVSPEALVIYLCLARGKIITNKVLRVRSQRLHNEIHVH